MKDAKVAREGRAIIPVLKVCCRTSFNKILVAKLVSSLSKEMKRMTATHTFVLDDVKFDRSERLRRTDAQSTDKVKKLRQELDTARNLVKDVLQRETMRKTGFAYEASIFEHRRTLIATKRKLGIRGDDEDLIPAKV